MRSNIHMGVKVAIASSDYGPSFVRLHSGIISYVSDGNNWYTI